MQDELLGLLEEYDAINTKIRKALQGSNDVVRTMKVLDLYAEKYNRYPIYTPDFMHGLLMRYENRYWYKNKSGD